MARVGSVRNRSRFRTSRIAQKIYVGGILVCSVVFGAFQLGNLWTSATTASTTTALSPQPNSRKILSSGVEIIPGFTGGKCGSNFYYTLGDKEVKVKKDDWEDVGTVTIANVSVTPEAYAQWEADSGGLLYVILSIYLFLGVAIICDGQFTDSLEMICSKFGLDLSPDVAGATFMAAGSSAPELATSFLGVFVAKSAVGLGTILGSAVFNILIIIGAVALLTGEPLDLDFRPVVRDNFFYAVSVILLCICLAVDNEVNLYDTIILLVWYALYILFMAFNGPIMEKFFPETEAERAKREAKEAKDADEDAQEAAAEGKKDEEETSPPSMGDQSAEALGTNGGANGDVPASVVLGMQASSVEDSSQKSNDGKEGEAASTDAGSHKGMGSGRGDTAPSGDEKAPAPASDGAEGEATAAADVEFDLQVVNAEDKKNDEGGAAAEGEGEKKEGQEEGDKKDKKKRPSYSSQIFRNMHDGKKKEDEEGKGDDGENEDEEEDEEEDPISYASAKAKAEEEGWGQCDWTLWCLDWVLWGLSWPYYMIFKYTMPDCHFEEAEEDEEAWNKVCSLDPPDPGARDALYEEQKAKLTCGQRWFWASFLISLVHISWLSYFMVEFMLKIGCLWGIPDVVMGLTFLAMGTSIPDALGSVSVAQDGQGDMAVSNAVGSNVFDICMGLGLPWFIKLCIDAGNECDYLYVCNASADVTPSIIILLAIIVVLFAVFVVGKWTLYPQAGYVLFATYGLFIIYQLLNTYVFNTDPPTCDNPEKSDYNKCA